MVEPSDTELVAAARKGDGASKASLEALLRRHQGRMYAICRRMTGNDADALDATQEALLAVVRGLERFDGKAKFSTWLYRVTTNACLDELRRRKRRSADPLPDLERSPGNDGRSEVADDVANRVDLDRALDTLSIEFRSAVVLRDVCRLDYAEIAEVLDIPAGTVRSRIARGRAALASFLDDGNQPVLDERQSTEP